MVGHRRASRASVDSWADAPPSQAVRVALVVVPGEAPSEAAEGGALEKMGSKVRVRLSVSRRWRFGVHASVRTWVGVAVLAWVEVSGDGRACVHLHGWVVVHVRVGVEVRVQKVKGCADCSLPVPSLRDVVLCMDIHLLRCCRVPCHTCAVTRPPSLPRTHLATHGR